MFVVTMLIFFLTVFVAISNAGKYKVGDSVRIISTVSSQTSFKEAEILNISYFGRFQMLRLKVKDNGVIVSEAAHMVEELDAEERRKQDASLTGPFKKGKRKYKHKFFLFSSVNLNTANLNSKQFVNIKTIAVIFVFMTHNFCFSYKKRKKPNGKIKHTVKKTNKQIK